MRLYQATRRDQLERLDRPVLRPLPATPFEYGEWKVARVNIDYHIELHAHYYSVPFALVHETVDLRWTATTVEIFHRGERLATHVGCSRVPGCKHVVKRRRAGGAPQCKQRASQLDVEIRLVVH